MIRTNIDVCLYDEDKDELFSMDFVDWKDLINLEIYKTIKMENFQILAHFLWQITFWGFSMEEINAKLKKPRMQQMNLYNLSTNI